MGHLLSDKFAFIENEYTFNYFFLLTQEWLLSQKNLKDSLPYCCNIVLPHTVLAKIY